MRSSGQEYGLDEVIATKRLTDMERNEIRKKADELREAHDGVFSGKNVKIVKLANQLGFMVGKAVLPDEVQGIIAVDKSKNSLLNSGSNMVIAVNDSLDKSKQRFIIAHELGHYILRENQEAPIFAHRETSRESEQESDADYFAACLLMPTKSFKTSLEYFKQIHENAQDCTLAALLSEQFGVPELAALRRIGEVKQENV